MATTKVNNVKANANANANANKVNNATANTESAKVENESANTESKQEATTSEPTSEQIASAVVLKKHETEITRDYKLENPKEVEKTKFAGAVVLGVYRVDESKKTKKNGDKTFYKVYYGGKIYDGWHSTEFCDEIGIERKHRTGSTPKATTLLDKLQALKNAIEAVGSEETDFVNFAKIVAKKIESEQIETERAAFLAKYEMVVGLFDMITEATFAKKYNSDDLALAKKLGYKFSDTSDDKQDDKQDDKK